MELGLERQVAFVAGSSRGIGHAIAAALLREGASVVLTGRDEESLRGAQARLEEAHGRDRVLGICGDMTQGAAIDAAVEGTLRHFGRIDHLIANVGGGSGVPGWNQPQDQWQRLFELNFFASMRLTQAVLPHFLGNGAGGTLLYVASIAGIEATGAPLPYSAAKAALINYAKNLARQLGDRNVRVNSIAPGNIWFEGGTWAAHMAQRPEAVAAMLQAEVPQRRLGQVDEVASLAVYLCSRLAAFCTGACYVVDGGQTRSL
ncbi:MAG TPA: SDR family oxidoreductase [Steroidobacteraceae bacterium]|nr:SDR family oxidoreductase [Steroidobacteraceae bacterium]